jgi:ankyrin repeat protein
LLLDRGADVEAKYADNFTALHLAVVSNQAEAVELLLDRGADIGVEDKDGHTPCETARQLRTLHGTDILGRLCAR